MNIFIAKLSMETQIEKLVEAFEIYGKVNSANIIKDNYTGESKGLGFVEMDNEMEAENAIRFLNNSLIDGHRIEVKRSTSPWQ